MRNYSGNFKTSFVHSFFITGISYAIGICITLIWVRNSWAVITHIPKLIQVCVNLISISCIWTIILVIIYTITIAVV